MSCLSGCCEKHGDKVAEAAARCVVCGGVSSAVVWGTAVVGAGIFGLYKIGESVYSTCLKQYENEYNVTHSTPYLKHLCVKRVIIAEGLSALGAIPAVALIAVGAAALVGCAFVISGCLKSRKFKTSDEGQPLLPVTVRGKG